MIILLFPLEHYLNQPPTLAGLTNCLTCPPWSCMYLTTFLLVPPNPLTVYYAVHVHTATACGERGARSCLFGTLARDFVVDEITISHSAALCWDIRPIVVRIETRVRCLLWNSLISYSIYWLPAIPILRVLFQRGLNQEAQFQQFIYFVSFIRYI